MPSSARGHHEQHVAVAARVQVQNVNREPWGSAGRSWAYHVVTITRRPAMSPVSDASAEVEMPCGHQWRVRRSSASQVSARWTARPGAQPRRARRLRSSRHCVDAHPPAEQLRERVDLGDVLIGSGQVDAPDEVVEDVADMAPP